MSEGSSCQHRALKPADFKQNSPVLWWPAPRRGLSHSHRVDSMQGHRLEHHPQWAHRPARSPSLRHTEPSVPFCSRPTLLWRREKKISGNHYLGIKCKPKNKSNQHRVGRHCQPPVTLFCLVSSERVWLALFASDTSGSWLFQGIHVNKALPFAR